MSLFSRLLQRPTAATPAWIEPDELSARLASEMAPLLIDVRGPDEFTGPLGHIAGAVNVPLPELPGRLAELAASTRPMVMVCKTDRRSAAAATQALAAGATDVAVLRGGMERWRSLGLP